MKNLFLNNKMDNYSSDINDNTVRWELPNIEFCSGSSIALSSFLIILKKSQSRSEVLEITTNLIDRSEFNPEGVILDDTPVKKFLHYDATNPIHWNVDYQRPRVFLFTLYGVEVSNIVPILVTSLDKVDCSDKLSCNSGPKIIVYSEKATLTKKKATFTIMQI